MHHHLVVLRHDLGFTNEWSVRSCDPVVRKVLGQVHLKALEIEFDGLEGFALVAEESHCAAPPSQAFHATFQLSGCQGVDRMDIDAADGIIRLKFHPTSAAPVCGAHYPLSPDELEETDDED